MQTHVKHVKPRLQQWRAPHSSQSLALLVLLCGLSIRGTGIPLRPLFQRLPVVQSWDSATPPVSTPSGGTELGFRYAPCFNAFRWYRAGIPLRPLFQRLPVVQSWDSATPLFQRLPVVQNEASAPCPGSA